MFGFGQLIGILKKNPKKIVFTEGEDPRILEASSRLLASYFLHPILIGDEKRIADAAEESGFNIRGAEIIDPEKFDKIDEMVELYCELRKKKGVTPDQAREILKQANYFGTMLVKMGFADALLGGATYSTADTVRPALQIIIWFLPVLFLFVQVLPVIMKYLLWAIVRSILILRKTIWSRSQEKQRNVPVSLM